MHFNMLLLMKCPLTQPVPLPSCSHIPVLITSQICSQKVHTLSKYRECYLTYLLMISSSRTCKIQEAVETKKQKSVPTNIDYSTLQRAHQYFMEGYIPEKHVMFCLKDNVIWIKANCYHSQKNYDAIHEVKVAIANEYPHHVTQATCSCVAGKAGMCSHVIDLLKQIIHCHDET